MKAIRERFYENVARIERCILLAGVLSEDAFPPDFDELAEGEDWETLERCFGEIPEDVKSDVDKYNDGESLAQWLLENEKLGFLIKMAAPIKTPMGKTGWTYSWGYYATRWVYGETLEAALDAGFAWVEQLRNKEENER